MKIRIRDVTSEGLEFCDQAMPGDMDIADDFIDPKRPVAVRGLLTRIDDYILAHLAATYTLDMVCARCLDKVHREDTVTYDLELEFGPRDEYVDIGRAIRDELLIGYNPHTLCREDCKGICAGCGAELNKEECKCLKFLEEKF